MDLFFPHEDRDRLDFKNSAMLVGFEELTAECMANIHLLQPHDRLAVLLIAWEKIGEFLTANLYTHSLGSVVCWVGKYTLELWFGRDWIVCTAENKSTLIDHMMKVYPAAYVLMHPYCWAHMFTIYTDPWMVEYLNFNFQRMNGSIEPPQILDAKDSEFIHREGISLILLRVIHMFEFRMLKLVKYLCVRLLWAYEDKKSSAYKMLHATPNAAEYMDYVRHVYLISICEYNGTSDLHFLIECIQRNCHCALSETETLHKSAQTIAEGLHSSKNTLSNFFNTFIMKTRDRNLNNAFGSAVNKYLIFITEYQLKKLFAMSSNEFTPAWEAIYQKLIRMFLIQRESSEELMKNTKEVAEKLFFGVRNLKSLTFAYEQVKQLTRPEWYTSKIGLLLSIITRKLNILEEFKFIANKTVEDLLKMEEDLSNYYRDFAKLLVKAPYLEQEAWLTTFSLHPCKDYMDAVTKCGSRNLRAIKKQAIKIKAIPGPEPKPPIKIDDQLVNIINEETDRVVQMETNDILSPTTTPLESTESNQPITSDAFLEAEFTQPSTSAAFLAAIQASADSKEKKLIDPKTVKLPKKRGPRSKYNKKDKVEKKKLTNSGIKSGGRGRPIGSTKIKSEMIKTLDKKLVKTATLKKPPTVTAAIKTEAKEAKESKFKDLAEAIYSAAAGAADDISTKTVESIKYPSFALMNSVTDTEELIKYTDYDDQIAQYHELNRILHSLRLKHCHYDDILALIIYPRYKRLTWATTWRNLKKRCRDLLNKENKKVLLVQQYMADANDRLTHLHIDYDKYKDKPQIDYGSIEDGYECFDSDSDDDLLQPVVVNSISTKEGDTSTSKTAKRRKRSHPIKPPLKYTELSINNTKGNDDNKDATNGITNQTENIVPSIMNTLKTSLSTPIYLDQPVFIVRRPSDNSSSISPQILAYSGKGPPITVNSIETISSPLLNIKTPMNLSSSSDSNTLGNQEKPRTSPTFSLVSGSSINMPTQCKLITIKNQPNTAYTLNQPLNLHSTNCLQPSETLNYTNQNPLNKSTVFPYVPQLTVVTAPQPPAVAAVRYKSNSQLHNLQMIPKQSHIDTTQMTRPPVPLKPSSSTPNLSGSAEDQPEDLTMPKKTTCMLPIKLAKPPQNLPLNLTARTSSMLINTDDLAASASESEYTNDDDDYDDEEEDNDDDNNHIQPDSSQRSTNYDEKFILPLLPTVQANDQQELFYQMPSTSDATLNNSYLINNDNANMIYDLTTTNNVPTPIVVQHRPKQLVNIGNNNNNANYNKQEPKKKEPQQPIHVENRPRQILAQTTSNNISQFGEKSTSSNTLNVYGNSINIIPGLGSVALVTNDNNESVLKGQRSPNIIEHLTTKDKPTYRIEGKFVDMVNVVGCVNTIVQNSNVPKVVSLTTRKIIQVLGTGNPPVIAPSKVPLTDAVGRVLTIGSQFSLTPEGIKMCEAARKARQNAEAGRANGSPPHTAENLTLETKSATIVTLEMPKYPICLSIQKNPIEPNNLLVTATTSPISISSAAPQNGIHIVKSSPTTELLELSIEATNLPCQFINKFQSITESSIDKLIVSQSSKNTQQQQQQHFPTTSKEIIIKWSPPRNKSEAISVALSPPHKNTSGNVVASSQFKNTSGLIPQSCRPSIVATSPPKNTSGLIPQSCRLSIVATSPPKNTSELVPQSCRPSIVATSPPKNTSEQISQATRGNVVASSQFKNTSELVSQSCRPSIVATSPPKNTSEQISQATRGNVVASSQFKNTSELVSQSCRPSIVATSPPKNTSELIPQPCRPSIVATSPPKNTSELIPQPCRPSIVATSPPKTTSEIIPQSCRPSIVATSPPKNTSELIPQPCRPSIVATSPPKNTSELVPQSCRPRIVATSPPKTTSELIPQSSRPSIVATSPPKTTSELIPQSCRPSIVATSPPKNTSELVPQSCRPRIVATSPPKTTSELIPQSCRPSIVATSPPKNTSELVPQSCRPSIVATSPPKTTSEQISQATRGNVVASSQSKNTSELVPQSCRPSIVATSPPKNTSEQISQATRGNVVASSQSKNTSELVPQSCRPSIVATSPPKNTSELITQSSRPSIVATSPPKNTSELVPQSCRPSIVATSPPKNTSELITQSSRPSIVATSPPKNTSELVPQSCRPSIVATSPPKNTSEQISQATRGNVVASSQSKNTSELVSQSSRPSIVATSPPKNTSELVSQSSRPSIVATSPPKNNFSGPTALPIKIINNLAWWSPPKNASDPYFQTAAAKVVASFPTKNTTSNPISQATPAKVVASFPPKNTTSNPISQVTPTKVIASFPPKNTTSNPISQATAAKVIASFASKKTPESISVATRTQIVASTPSKNTLELNTLDTSKEKRLESNQNKNTSELISEISGEKITASLSPKSKSPQPTREKPFEKIVASFPPKTKLQSISESPIEKICDSSIGNKAVSPPYKSQPIPVTSIEKAISSPPHKNTTSQLISVASKEKIVALPSPKNISQPIQETSIGKVAASTNKYTIAESSIERTTTSPSFKEKTQTNVIDLSVDVTPKPLKEGQIVAKNPNTPFNILPSSSKITISPQPTSPPKKDNNVTDNVKILCEGFLTNDTSNAPINDPTLLKTDDKYMNATWKLSPVEKAPVAVNLANENDPKINQSLPNTSQSIKNLTPFCPDEWDSDLSRPDSLVDLTLDSDTQSQGGEPVHEIFSNKDKVFNNNLLDPHLKTYKNIKGITKIDHNYPCTSRRVLRIRKGLRAVIKDVRFNVKNFPLEAKNPPQVITYMEVDTDNEQPTYDDTSQSSMMSFYDPLDMHTTRMINSFRKPISLKRQLSPLGGYSPVAVKRPSLDKDQCEEQVADSFGFCETSSDEEFERPRSIYNPVVTPITPMVSDTDEMQIGTEEKGNITLKMPLLSNDALEAQIEDSVDLFGSSTEAETDRQLSFHGMFSPIKPMVSGTEEMQSETEDALARITLKPLLNEEEEKVAIKRLSLGKDACEAHPEDSVDLFESSTEAETEVQRLRLFNLYSPITPIVSDIEEMQSEAEDTSAKLSPKPSPTDNITTNLIELIQEVTGVKKFNPESQITQLVSNETKNQTNEENNSQNKVTHIGITIKNQSNEEGKQAITTMFPHGPTKVGEYWAYAQVVDQTPENLERVNKIFNKLKTTVQQDTNPVPPSTTPSTTELEFKPLSVPIRRMIMRARYVVFNQAYINEREKFVAEVAKQGLMEQNEDSNASILIASFTHDKSLNDDSLMSLLQMQVESDEGERLSSALIGVVLKITMSGAALRRNISIDENEQPSDNQQQNGREKVDASTTLHEFYLERRTDVDYEMYSPIISLNKLLDGTLEESVPIPRECFGSDEEEGKLSVSLNHEQIKKIPVMESETSVVVPTVVEKRPKRKIQTRKQAGKNLPITRRASLRSLNKTPTVSTCRNVSPSGSTEDSKKQLSQEESDDNTDAELDVIYECATMSTANDSEDDTGSEYEPRPSRPKVVKPMRLRCIGRRSTNRVELNTETSSCSNFATAQKRTRQFAAKSTSSPRTRRSQLLMETATTTRNTIEGLSAADKAALLHHKCVDVEVRLSRLSSREAEMCRKPVIKIERHAAIGKYLKTGQNEELQQNNNETETDDDESIYSENLDDEENEADDESEDMDKDEFKKKPTRRHSLVGGLRKEFIRNLNNKTTYESESCSETNRKPTRFSKRRSAERNQHEHNLREQQSQVAAVREVSGKDGVVNTRRRTTPMLSESSGTEEDEEEKDEITSNGSSEDINSDDDDDDDDDDDNGNGHAGRATSRASIPGNTAAGSSNYVAASSSKQSTSNTNEPPSTSRKRENLRSQNCNTGSESRQIPIPKNSTKNGEPSVVDLNSSSEEDTTNATEGTTNTGGTGDGTEPSTAPPTEDTGARSVTLAQIIRILRENLITTGSRHLSSKPAVPECVFQDSVAESITATIHPPTETSAQRVEISHNLAPVDVIDRLRDIIRRTLARLTVVERSSERRLARQRRQRIRNDRIARNNENIRQLRLLEERLNERVSRRRSLSSSSESRCSTPEVPSCQDPRRYIPFYPDYGQSGASSPAYSTPEY